MGKSWHTEDAEEENGSGNCKTSGEILQSFNMRSFRFSDLKTATGKFSNLLREGGFGRVFKGWIDENTFTPTRPGTGIVIAVKLLKSPERFQDQRQWMAEVNYLGQLYHPNLVNLIGYCAENGNRILVYEYTLHGSLEDHLYRLSDFQPLSWNVRMKVALGAAKGLAFLDSAETQVTFRDFRTSNILLDSTYNAKLSDFEFAKDYPGDKSPIGDQNHVSTRVMVDREYVAPEYVATGHLTASSNVYSFGVVFLEILCGRKAIDIFRPSGEENLIEWAKPYLPSKVSSVIDTRVEGQYTQPEALKAGKLVLQCLSVDPKDRPTMEKVVASLERLQDSGGPTSPKPSLCSVM